MRRVIFITAVMLVSLAGRNSDAFSIDRGYGLKDKVVGGYWSNGFALIAGDGYEDWMGYERENRTPLYSPGGYFYFDFYLTSILAIEGGFGFLSKGIRFKDGDDRVKQRVVYMEIPVMAKIDIQHIQFAAGLALFVGLSGKTKTVVRDNGNEATVEDNWNGDDWEYVRRANVGPRIYAGYAIPVGPIYIVPSMTWMMHLVNDLDNDRIDEDFGQDDPSYQMRAMNLMFNVGVEWAF